METVYIIDGVRTPIASFQGSLTPVSAVELAKLTITELLKRSKVSPELVDEVIIGNVLQAGVGQAPARQAALKAGLPASIAAVTVNKVCGSGLKAAMFADQAIRCGDAKAIVAGGMENMSAAPHLAKGLRGGVKLGDTQLVDAMVLDGLTCSFESCHMGMHAEHIAKKFDVTRQDQDEFAFLSPPRAANALASPRSWSKTPPPTPPSRWEWSSRSAACRTSHCGRPTPPNLPPSSQRASRRLR